MAYVLTEARVDANNSGNTEFCYAAQTRMRSITDGRDAQ